MSMRSRPYRFLRTIGLNVSAGADCLSFSQAASARARIASRSERPRVLDVDTEPTVPFSSDNWAQRFRGRGLPELLAGRFGTGENSITFGATQSTRCRY